jgi:CBS domain-containing protein
LADSVSDIMETDVPAVYETDSLDTVLRVMRDHDLSGGDAALHLPHYFERFGGLVFLEPMPVSEHGQLVGVGTRLDVLGALAGE